MKAVLIGYGEVGRGVYEVLSKYHEIHIHDIVFGEKAFPDDYDLMLVAIPYSDRFIDIVRRYRDEDFHCKAVVIFSTVPVGTCQELNAIHSPIEGDHTNMAESIRRFPRWIGGYGSNALIVKEFFKEAGLGIIQHVEKSETTEFLKLQSLAAYGIGIEWARYCKKSADGIGFDYSILKMYNQDYNDLVEANGQPQNCRYNLNPPKEGEKIGGHCVLAGMGRLQEKFGHPFIQTVLDLNKEPCK